MSTEQPQTYHFEPYEKEPPTGKLPHAPSMTIEPGGSIRLNKAALTLLGGKPQRVTMLYDASRKAIGIRPATNGQENTYQLSMRKENPHTAFVTVRSFIKHHNLKILKPQKRPAKLTQGDVLVAEFGETTR